MKIIKLFLLGLPLIFCGLATSAQFITTWKTDNLGTSADNEITIPTLGGGYNYNVDWGDTNTDVGVTGNKTHTYAVAGIYTVIITGTFPRIYFGNTLDRRKILTVEQWGSNSWTSMALAFRGCENLTIPATDSPDLSGVTDMSSMFQGTDSFNSDISGWDISTITNLSSTFRDALIFNQPLNTWDVSSVTNMRQLFRDAAVFNQPLDTWNVSSVVDISWMFFFARSFNQDIGSWEVDNVTNMSLMFASATDFNQDISLKPGGGNLGGDGWNTANVVNMSQMFSNAESFNQDISNWNTNSLTNMTSIFSGASVFDQNISIWNISLVTNLSNVFKNASAFNQNLSGWNTYFSNITNMSSMFDGAISFNQDISSWDVSNVADMSSMFTNSTFNPNISGWNVSSVSNFNSMFDNNPSFNQNISSWVTTSASDMRGMFGGATSFNQNISGWNVSSAVFMAGMFNGASSFDQDLGGWDVSNVTNFSSMLNNSGLSVENYDNLLTGWSILTLQMNMVLGATNLYYCSSSAARNTIITNFNWSFSDKGQGCIAVFKGNDTTGPQIINGQVAPIDFGSINIAPGSKTLSFTFDSQIAAGITNFNLTITNNTGTAFTLVPTPALPISISFGSPLTLNITLSNLAVGTFTETVSLTADNFANPFEFTITGVVTATPEPEISVFQGPDTNGIPILDGDPSGYFLGGALRGTDIVNQFTITNIGSAILNVSSLTVSGTGYSLNPNLPFTLPVNGTQTITITLDGTVAGLYKETIIINSNDIAESAFNFAIVGIIQGPEISVFDGPSRFSYPEIMDGQVAPVDFGIALQGTDIVLPITIANMGFVNLTISDISISGSAYSISAVPPILVVKVVDGLVSTVTYNLTLNSTAVGVFNEVVTITSDDDTNSLFTFNLTGEILAPSVADPPHIYWTENIGSGGGDDEIHRTDLNGNNFLRYYTGTADEIAGVAMDSANNRIYWTDAALARIRYGEIGPIGLSSGPTTLVTFPTTTTNDLEDLALDLTNGYIYFTHGNAETGLINKIGRVDLDGTNFVELIDLGLDEEPFGIDIDHTNGKLYFTTNSRTTGHDARLYRSNLDGSVPEELFYIGTSLAAGHYLRDVKIDPVNEVVYWSGGLVDQPNGTIYYNDINEAGPFVAPSTFTSPGEPIGLDLDMNANKIYWVCRGSGAGSAPPEIMRSNLDGSSTEVVFTVTIFPATYPSGPPGSSFIALDLRSTVTTCVNPPTANAGVDQTLCEADIAILSATTGGTVTPTTWTTSGDGSFDDATSLVPNYTPGSADIIAGTVTLTITTDDPDGPGPCVATADNMTISISPAPTSNAGTDIIICESDILNLNGIIGGSATSALWTTDGDGTFDDNTSLTAIYTPGANDFTTGTFTLTLTTDDPTGPCVAATDDIIIDLEFEYTTDAGVDQVICSGDPAILSGSTDDPTQSVFWSTAGDGSFDDNTSLSPNYTPGSADLASGTTTLTLETASANVCSPFFDDVIINISQPIVVVNQSGSLDVAQTIIIDVSSGGTFNTGDVLTTTLLTQPVKGTAVVNADGSISYTASAGTVGADSFDFEVCNQCGLCSAAAIAITINNVPPTVVIPPSSVIAGGIATINVLDGITDDNGNIDLSSLKILIQPQSGAVASLDAFGILTVDYSGLNFAGTDEITIEVCDIDGLCTQEVITIEVLPPGVVVYNAVSPNGDGRHDYLEIENAEFFPANRVKIMNRWGDVVYQIDGYDNAANSFIGVANNGGSGELPPGTYYYNIVLGDDSPELNGFFSLRR